MARRSPQPGSPSPSDWISPVPAAAGDPEERSSRRRATPKRGLGADDPEAPGAEARDSAARDPEARARQICLRMLTISPRSRAQLATALRSRGIPADAADAVLARFTDVGLIDDAAFARAWVESRHHSRGLSRRSLSAELRHQGVPAEEIRQAVGTLDPDQEVATARRLVEQKLAASRGQPPEVRARRA